jgi:hypothetical protein
LEITNLLNNKKSNVYTFKKTNKKIILTFFNDGESTKLQTTLLERLKKDNISIPSIEFLEKTSRETGYIGSQMFYPIERINYIKSTNEIPNKKQKLMWTQHFKSLYGNDIFNHLNILEKELNKYAVINISKNHKEYLKSLTNISLTIESDNLILVGHLYHELGHLINKTNESEYSLIEALYRENYSDIFSLIQVATKIKQSNLKKNIFNLYAKWQINTRNKINLNKNKYLNKHYTVPALSETIKHIDNNWSILNIIDNNSQNKHIFKVSKAWSYKHNNYKSILESKLTNKIELITEINRKTLEYQKAFKENINIHYL